MYRSFARWSVLFAVWIALVSGMALSAAAQTPVLTEVQKLLASDHEALDRFGVSVAVSGRVAVIGASNQYDNGSESGSAYVYRFDGTSWVEEQELLAADAQPGAHFGYAVAVSGDVAVVGAFLDGNSRGSAYVYRFDGTSWVEEQKLLATDGQQGDVFGYAVAVSGDVALVGAMGEGDRYYYSLGSVYVYRFDGVNWAEEHKLRATDGQSWDQFGSAVAVSGDLAVVAAPFDDDNGENSGSAYVYRFDGASWVEEGKLLASDGVRTDAFGWSVAVSEGVAVIGSCFDDDYGAESGSAYVYRFDGTSWVAEQKLLASDGAAGDFFGFSVGVSKDVAVIGARLDDDNGETSGSAYVYRFDGVSWAETQKLLPSDGARDDVFGTSVAISEGVAVIGAFLDDEASGSAYVFHIRMPVESDIRPGSDLNPINPMSRGVIPVALLGSDSFDVADVDETTLAFGPAGGPPAHGRPHFRDVNGDGWDDLLVHFRTEESGVAFGDTEACVTGELFDGTPFEGCDSIQTTPPRCGEGFELALVIPAVIWHQRRRRRARG